MQPRRGGEDAAKVIDVGAERQLGGNLGRRVGEQGRLRLGSAAPLGGISKPAAGPASAAGPGCGSIVCSAMVELLGKGDEA